ncbi:CaiB/BaiF CoA-transferase family protein [Azospirillum sp. B4]|uniref:CaiB/BaiF CoA transferase family protein n=1 Tax=Azospirillum sp. B4 TaxID=95605 RepID=UPI00034D2731|nr:CoA transferase [Azospirillum sp. B4]
MVDVLKGIRVVEQGTFITGPCAAMLLADLGADVIKIESPEGGDPYRNFKGGFYSAHFQAYNHNKRSLCLDLKKAADRSLFHGLVGSADVYIQNFRPGVAGRIGAGWPDLSAVNPKLVYCSISGFGKDGPYNRRPSYDSVTQALSGFLSVAIDPANPRLLGPALADAITGLYAALGIMGALVQRGRTGEGRHLEISMLEAMMHFAIEPFAGYFALGEVPTGMDRPRLAQAMVLTCGDGQHVVVHMSSLEKFWDALVAGIDGHALTQDPRFATRLARIDHYTELVAALNVIFATRPRAEWVARLSDTDLPFAPVNSIADTAADPQVEHLKMLVPVARRLEGADRLVRSPFSYGGERDDAVVAAPQLGQHDADIRAALAERPDVWPELV